MKARCINCKYYLPGSTIAGGERLPECRAEPPTGHPMMVQGEGGQTGIQIITVFPSPAPEQWCGRQASIPELPQPTLIA